MCGFLSGTSDHGRVSHAPQGRANGRRYSSAVLADRRPWLARTRARELRGHGHPLCRGRSPSEAGVDAGTRRLRPRPARPHAASSTTTSSGFMCSTQPSSMLI